MAGAGSERTVLLGCLTAVSGLAVTALVGMRWQPRAPIAVIAAVGAVVLGMSAVLRVRRTDWGRERRYLDLWSVPHFLVGVGLALCGVALWEVAALAVIWELIELLCRVREYPSNRVVDVVLAIAGWCSVGIW
jgi:hypothetical protein